MSGKMTATASTRMGTVLTLGVVLVATLSALLAMPSVSADTSTYDGEIDLYGYKITMGLIEPDQVDTVEWDFGDGSATETVKITSDNPVGKIQHTYAAKGDYTVTATMRNQYTDPDTGELKDGESKLVYLYHIHGYPVVTFVSNGGSDVASIEGTASHYVPTRPADPVKEGSQFSGWFIDEECTQAFDWTSEVTKHITLYAGWDIVLHTVSFDLNGGTGNVSDLRIAEGKTATAPEDPVKDGFDFDGWYLGDERFDFSSPIASDITLTAHWKEKAEAPAEDDKEDSDGMLPIIILVIGIILGLAALFTGYYFLGLPTIICIIAGLLMLTGIVGF